MIDEEEKKPNWKKKILHAVLAIGIIWLCAFVAYRTETGEIRANSSQSEGEAYDTTAILTLKYSRAISYKVDTSEFVSLEEHSPCKVINSTVKYNNATGKMTFQFEGQRELYYDFVDFTQIPGQIVVTPDGVSYVTMTRVMNDSTLVILERPYLVILSKGTECIKFEDLPIPGN